MGDLSAHAPRQRMLWLLAAADFPLAGDTARTDRPTREQFDALMVLTHRIVESIQIAPLPPPRWPRTLAEEILAMATRKDA